MAIHTPGREERRGDPDARVKRYLSYVLALAASVFTLIVCLNHGTSLWAGFGIGLLLMAIIVVVGDAVRGRGDPYYTTRELRWYVSVPAAAALLISVLVGFWLGFR
jgi:hypothetical protein